MMIFTGKQLEYLRFEAERLLFDLEERTSKFQYTKEQKVGVICGHLQEICSTGRAIALDEVSSTPWEWNWTSLNVESLNEMSAQGWEMVSVVGAETPIFIWRRRKAVRMVRAKYVRRPNAPDCKPGKEHDFAMVYNDGQSCLNCNAQHSDVYTFDYGQV